jgi:arylsulfatase A-like enzyme
MKSTTRRQFIKYTSKFAGALGVCRYSSSAYLRTSRNKNQPNLLYIMTDQMRFSAMGCMEGAPGVSEEPGCVRTPNLDRLAGEGVLFENAFSTTPVCSPYRTGLQTGKYSHATGFKLNPNEVTLPQVLRQSGYRTGYIGKWHMTPHEYLTESGYVPPQFRPGWDYFAGLEVSHKYFDTKIFIGDDEIARPVEGYEPVFQTDLAIDFMRQNKGGPFLLMLSWGPPHNPYTPPLDLYDSDRIPLRPNVPDQVVRQARESIAGYYGLVTSLDEQVGRIATELEELGLSHNTILCFSSDHGDMLHSQGQILKRRPWDEAARIPLIMRWPDALRPGQRRGFVFGSVNFMPTLVRLLGSDPPEGVQGRDLSRVILDPRAREPGSILLEQIAPGNTPFNAKWRAIRTREWLFAISGHLEKEDWLLYDMYNDPYQMNNLVERSDFRDVKMDLKRRLDAWRRQTSDTADIRQDYISRSRNPGRLGHMPRLPLGWNGSEFRARGIG